MSEKVDNIKEMQIKLWQLFVSIAGLLTVLVGAWISINLEIKELQVRQNNQFKQIELNTKKIEILYEDINQTQKQMMRDVYDIKLMIRDQGK
jgi:hypothetical protein